MGTPGRYKIRSPASPEAYSLLFLTVEEGGSLAAAFRGLGGFHAPILLTYSHRGECRLGPPRPMGMSMPWPCVHLCCTSLGPIRGLPNSRVTTWLPSTHSPGLSRLGTPVPMPVFSPSSSSGKHFTSGATLRRLEARYVVT